MNAEALYKIKSADGRVLKVYDDRVVLTQEGVVGMLSRGLSGYKTIYFKDITSIQFKEAGWTAGYMEFTFPGSNDRGGGPISGVTNENRFTFGKPTIGAARKLNIEVLKVKAFIENKIDEIKKQGNESSQKNNVSKADEISKLKSLLDNGAISKEEYDNLKRDIIKTHP